MSDEFTAKRVGKMTDNKDCTPIELLRYALYEIESGEIDPDCMMIIAAKRDGSKWDMVRYRSNLTREAEIAMLESEKQKAVRNWIGEQHR